jgi:hypothetical protein
MKKVVVGIIFILVVMSLFGCQKEYVFEVNDIILEDDSVFIEMDRITKDIVDDNHYSLGIWKSDDQTLEITHRYIFFNSESVKYFEFLFKILYKHEDEIIKAFKNLDDIGYITLDLEMNLIYIAPKSLSDNTLNDVLVLEEDFNLYAPEDINDISNEDLTKVWNQYKQIDIAPLVIDILNSEYSLYNFATSLDTISNIALIEGYYPFYDLKEGFLPSVGSIYIDDGIRASLETKLNVLINYTLIQIYETVDE